MKPLMLALLLGAAFALSACDTVLAGVAQFAGTAVVWLW